MMDKTAAEKTRNYFKMTAQEKGLGLICEALSCLHSSNGETVVNKRPGMETYKKTELSSSIVSCWSLIHDPHLDVIPGQRWHRHT